MEVKHFLKPAISKVVLTLILFYPILLIFLFLGFGINVDCAADNWNDNCVYNPPIIGIEIGLGSSVVLAIVFAYLISCTIVSIFYKIKSK